MKRLGVIGGLGPIATAYFLQLVIQMTDVTKDQDHVDMIIYNRPSIPDRTSYILDHSKESPVIPMISIGQELVEQGVELIAIPCITAHYFHDTLTSQIHVPIIHIIKETVDYLKVHQISVVGIMATDGTIQSGIFQKECLQQGIQPIVPKRREQSYVMDLIYEDVKANQPVHMEKFRQVSSSLFEEGAQVILLGCTELSLIKRDYTIGAGYLDVMELLAMKSVVLCGAPLKQEYKSLITTKGENYANKCIGISGTYRN